MDSSSSASTSAHGPSRLDEEEQRMEKHSSEVVHWIQKFIEALRDIFYDASKTKIRGQVAKQRGCTSSCPVSIFTHSGVQKIEKEISNLRLEIRKDLAIGVSDPQYEWEQRNGVPEEAKDHEKISESRRLLRNILVPMFDSLILCYEVLDQLTTETVPQHSRNKKNQRPKPPVGMLSIQNYTDIACLLEFTVCNYLCTGSSTTTVLNDRVQYALPKSLAGRIPREALFWRQDDSSVEEPKTVSNQDVGQTLILLTKLVCLDRFRPMLLPRHWTDVLAGTLQLEHEMVSMRDTYSDTDASRLNLLLRLVGEAKSVPTDIQARSLQSLLFQGMKTPRWLRKRVSTMLHDLARKDLLAILRTFVLAATPGSRTAASLRLAKVLLISDPLSSSSQSTPLDEAVSAQLISTLDALIPPEKSMKELYEGKELTDETKCFVQFVWSILNELGPELSHSFLQEKLVGSLHLELNEPNIDFHSSIRRLGLLLLAAPSTANTTILLQAVTVPVCILDRKVPIVDLVIRACILASIEVSTLKHDAAFLIRTLVSAAEENGGLIGGQDPSVHLAILVTEAIRASSWETVFSLSVARNSNTALESVLIFETQSDSLESIISGIEKRATYFFADILRDEPERSVESSLCKLPQAIFNLVVISYLFPTNYLEMYPTLKGFAQRLGVAPMIILPVLVENISLARYLFSEESATPFINISSIVFGSVANLTSDCRSDTMKKRSAGVLSVWENILVSHSSIGSSPGEEIMLNEFGPHSVFDSEQIFSLCAILLNILISILELGAERRSEKDEALLQELMGDLSTLATITQALGETKDLPLDEISDLSRHCLALIGSRQCLESTPTGVDVLDVCRLDLESDQPPIRARGVVKLRHLAHSLLAAQTSTPGKTGLVQIVNDAEATSSEDSLDEIVDLLITALHDSESYVYLAAISSLAHILENSGSDMFYTISRSVLTGKWTRKRDIGSSALSIEQRLKINESLMISLRRRAVIGPSLERAIDLLLCGDLQSDKRRLTHEEAEQVHSETLSYLEDEKDDPDLTETRFEPGGRLAVGGPLFQAEENDAMRAALLNFAVEVVRKADKHVFVRHAAIFVNGATESIRIDSSRLLRRAGATLAREIYNLLVDEQDEYLEDLGRGTPAQCPCAMAVASSNEESLALALERCMKGLDRNDRPHDNNYIDDLATKARCEEALWLRQQIFEGGILTIATAATAEQGTNSSIDLVQRLLQKKQEKTMS